MCDNTREIITIQIGHYANYIGTHWWNLQERSFIYDGRTPTDLNHDFLFQSGLTQSGDETYTPRLLIVDSMGSLGGLSSTGSLYGSPHMENIANIADTENVSNWDRETIRVEQLPHTSNPFIRDLHDEEIAIAAIRGIGQTTSHDTTLPSPSTKSYDLRRGCVKYWSDYLRPHLHPGTMCLLPSVSHTEVAGCADAMLIEEVLEGVETPSSASHAYSQEATVDQQARTGRHNKHEMSSQSMDQDDNLDDDNSEGGYGSESEEEATSHSISSAVKASAKPYCPPPLVKLWGFLCGAEVARTESVADTLSDAVRKLAERCDSMQGFHLVCHGYDGMGGVASVMAEHIRDEYCNKTLMSFPVHPPTLHALPLSARSTLLASTILSYSGLCECSDIVVPLNLRHHPWGARPLAPTTTWQLYNYRASSHYESSSVLAVFLECVSGAWRRRGGRGPALDHVPPLLTPRGMKVVCGNLGLPAPASLSLPDVDATRMSGGSVSGRPSGGASQQLLGQLITRRGHCCAEPEWNMKNVVVQQLRDSLPTTAPFPAQLFTPVSGHTGLLKSVSCEARLHQSCGQDGAATQLITQLLNDGRLLRNPTLIREAVDDEESWTQAMEGWADLAECYGVETRMRTEDDDDY